MKINPKQKKKLLVKRGEDDIVASYSLPEVNIYPNNRFGDIARSQGLETARNWRKVREGTIKGRNEFGRALNSGVQLASSFLPVVGDIQDAKDLYTSVKNKDYIGTILSGLGFVPILGGIASNQIKSSNITEDNYGNLIPLSKRDNFANPDVRYSIIPLTLFGTSLYNRKKNEQKKSSKD